jgi:hypothetical protein
MPYGYESKWTISSGSLVTMRTLPVQWSRVILRRTHRKDEKERISIVDNCPRGDDYARRLVRARRKREQRKGKEMSKDSRTIVFHLVLQPGPVAGLVINTGLYSKEEALANERTSVAF